MARTFHTLLLIALASLVTFSSAAPQWKFVASNKAAAKAATGWVSDAINAPDADAVICNLFEDYKNAFSKKYADTKTEKQALNNFKAALQRIHAINNDDTKTYWTNVNQFSDLSFEQFSKIYLKNSQVPPGSGANETKYSPPPRSSRRSLQQAGDFDWRSLGKVTPVKDQGMCGCCYAFAATAAIESAYLIASGASNVDLSEEQLVSCAGSGCGGGNSATAMQYVLSNNQVSESSFYYTASNQACNQGGLNAMPSVKFAGGSSVVFVPANSETAMLQAVRQVPVAFFWSADDAFMYYAGGIYSSSSCNFAANHGLVAVGFSTSQNYWIAKNSWTTGWGEGGYVRIAMTGNGNTGMCGMYTYAHYLQASGIAQML